MSDKKLYRVSATIEVLVLAEDPFSAERVVAREATDEMRFSVLEVRGAAELPPGWTNKTLVYQSSIAEDITAEAALSKARGDS